MEDTNKSSQRLGFMCLSLGMLYLTTIMLSFFRTNFANMFIHLPIFSFIGHKEIRFLLPIVPHLFCVIGDYTYRLIGDLTIGDKTYKGVSASKIRRYAF